MAQDTRPLPETASQTAGPYVHIGLSPKEAGFEIYANELGAEIAGPGVPGTRIRVEGTVWDGEGAPVRDVMIEVWQADAKGAYAPHGAVASGFRGWGRVICDFDTGAWGFDTIMPGTADDHAPHLCLWIAARGINTGLHTRLYFPDHADLHSDDPVLRLIPQAQQQTLVAQRDTDAPIPLYRFDIVLQGEGETVFLDI